MLRKLSKLLVSLLSDELLNVHSVSAPRVSVELLGNRVKESLREGVESVSLKRGSSSYTQFSITFSIVPSQGECYCYFQHASKERFEPFEAPMNLTVIFSI